jgi:hypothetical protein
MHQHGSAPGSLGGFAVGMLPIMAMAVFATLGGRL